MDDRNKKAKIMGDSIRSTPFNLEAEQAILGGILLNNDAMNQVSDLLGADDFYKEGNRLIFHAMAELFKNDELIDIVTLSQALKEIKQPGIRSIEGKDPLEMAGGLDYLGFLVESFSTSAGVRYHAEIVKDMSLRRKLIGSCSEISSFCYEPWRETRSILDQAEQSIYNIAEGNTCDSLSPFGAVINESFHEIDKAHGNEGELPGIATGFQSLDRMTAGMQKSELVIIAARPSVGKTALALNIGYNVAKKTDKVVAIFSLEMSKKQLGIRFLSFDSRIDAMRLRTGRIAGDEWERLIDSADRLTKLPIFIDDTSGVNVLEIKSRCRKLMKREKIGIIIIDYLQLMRGTSHGKVSPESRQVEISEISRSLKGLAKDLDVPVIALSQLNRKAEDRQGGKPQLADLRESGAIEQDADVVLFIRRLDGNRDGYSEDANVVEIILAKHRNGPTGKFNLTFLSKYARFENFIEEM